MMYRQNEINVCRYTQWLKRYYADSFQNACFGQPCVNNATCQTGFTQKGYRCICPVGYTGEQCQMSLYSTGEHVTLLIIIIDIKALFSRKNEKMKYGNGENKKKKQNGYSPCL